ncbi:MAG: 1-acyl-sn-glycerol-3-phosphate acyltransferase [Hyphomicrobiaceae bacterium]|nr:MAG: 1-acyl-sn-glycerol-3-phosphate acyltransferase [Hyphomicrobiaceae bacterium]
MQAPDVASPITFGSAPPAWRVPAAGHILGCELPHLGLGDRLLLRGLMLLARRQIAAVHGLQHVRPAMDPFILAMNHGTRRESLLVPALLFLNRGGRLIHFLADWNFQLIPGVGLIYRRAQVVTVTRKSAKPRALNGLKPFFRQVLPPFELARAHLLAGRPVGIFPEGTVNRDPDRLLRGRRGAARLSLETGAPIVPMGIRFPGVEPGSPVPEHAAMELHIGAPLTPPGSPGHRASVGAVSTWHAAIMNEIARLSGKAWTTPMKEASHGRS